MMELTPGAATLAHLHEIWQSGAPVKLAVSADAGVRAAHDLVLRASEGEAAIYGVNTGFGKLASVKIAHEDTATLQRNLILSHCCGVGEALDVATTRLMMAMDSRSHNGVHSVAIVSTTYTIDVVCFCTVYLSESCRRHSDRVRRFEKND